MKINPQTDKQRIKSLKKEVREWQTISERWRRDWVKAQNNYFKCREEKQELEYKIQSNTFVK